MTQPDVENVFLSFPHATRQEPSSFSLSASFSLSPDAAFRHDLRKCLLALPYRAFLIVIAQLLERQGCRDVHLLGREGFVGRNCGGGWDLEATLPPAQSFTVGQHGVCCIVQAKQFGDLAIQQRTVDELRGCCLRAGAGQGLLITTSRFSPVAQQAAEASALAPIALVGGDHLIDLLIQYELGVTRLRNGKWQLDLEFFRSPHIEAAASLNEKAQALASKAHQRQKDIRAATSDKPENLQSSFGLSQSNSRPTVLHFSITVDAGESDAGEKRKKRRVKR